ncbi:class I SAM-dependent methyltransferase [Geomicrobium sp. JSM 1781026]|uniref:class I SAM-dependent methyltransferase n=1 Tax=Geomicrobium sp. JSM 1781026 TaxID=3344580 RepID=UPI0035BF137A
MESYFYEAFEDLSRLAPGSDSSTSKVATLVKKSTNNMKILDIGCGNGVHTLLLADLYPNARIIAVDTHQPYIDELLCRVERLGLEERIQVHNQSMLALDFPHEYFDLIWAEGSIYIIGFQQGLSEWKALLKPGGQLVCSEISWLHSSPSSASRSFWEEGYPEINTVANKVSQITENGYEYCFSYVLPYEDWTEHYYEPLARKLDEMTELYIDVPEALEVIGMIQMEIELFHDHPNDYSYVFYGMQKMKKKAVN